MTTLVVLSVVDIVLLIAGLAIYLYVVGTGLTRIAANLEECAEIVQAIGRNAQPIMQDVRHINRTGGVVAGALPLLYGMAEQIVTSVTPRPPEPAQRPPALPASGTRRSRLAEGVGYHPVS
ncbi:MAG TPA: hypothetical protein VH085_08095 [Nocardioides sp.]|jgi:hypothetical protein|nr:hypothetical protein [Nocardioides sp.]